MYTMSGPALNIPTGREIRQNNREQRRNTTQQKIDREVRMSRRDEMRTSATSDVSTEISSMMTRRNITTRAGRKATSYF
jgi:hypothetical protein